jgi:cyclopropane fatty-acyl-phospholipid synthase-like methyltransferase
MSPASAKKYMHLNEERGAETRPRSYIHSHTAPEKGRQYDVGYATDPWHAYLWSRERKVLDTVFGEFLQKRDVRLLDFACGTGRILCCLEERVTESTGVDVSESMLAEAKRKARRSTLLLDNILESNALAGRKFDLITAFRFFPNAEEELRRKSMATLATLLADDGLLVLNNHQNKWSLRYSISRLLAFRAGEAPPPMLSMRHCRELAGAVGLEIVRVYSVGLLGMPRIHLSRQILSLADRLASGSSVAAGLSEGPVMVCRKKAG